MIIDSNNIRLRIFKNRLLFVVVCVFAGLTAIPLVAILGEVIIKGWQQFNWHFLTGTMPNALDGIVGTFLMLIVAAVVAIPVGIFCGTCLSEYRKSWFSIIVSYLTDLLQGTPSIIIGIVTYIWIFVPMKGYSGFAGSVALFIMMLPLIIRSTEETLKILPPSLKEAGLALGGSYWRVMLQVIIPSAFGSIFTGILLAISRVIGETAPLMFTAMGATAISVNMEKPMSAVPLLIWEFFNDPNLQSLIWGASLFLLTFVLCLNLLAKRIGRKWKI